MTVCMWKSSLGPLIAKKGADIRTAGDRGTNYWVPLLRSKGWDTTQFLTVWVSGKVPAKLLESSETPVTDDELLTSEQKEAVVAHGEDSEEDLGSLFPWQVHVVDGMNRTLALRVLARKFPAWRERAVTLRVLDPRKLESHKTAIAMALNEKSMVCLAY